MPCKPWNCCVDVCELFSTSQYLCQFLVPLWGCGLCFRRDRGVCLSVGRQRGPLKSSKGHGGGVRLGVRRWLRRPIHAWKVLWQHGQGMAGTSGRGPLARAFLACLRCSAAAVLLASRIMEPLSTGAPIDPVLSGLLPGVRVDAKRFQGCL